MVMTYSSKKRTSTKTTETHALKPIECPPVDEASFLDAVRNNNISTVESVLRANPNWVHLRTKDEHGFQPIHIATQEGFTEMVKLMLDEFGADYKAESQKGAWIPAHQCAKYGHSEIFRVLASKGEDVNIRRKNKYRFTPLFWAVQQGHTEFCKMLVLEYGVSTSEESGTLHRPLHLASECGQTDIIKFLLCRRFEDVNMRQSDRFGYTPLHWACRMGHLDAVVALLESGADYFAETSTNKQTPLALAEKYERTSVVSYLKDYIHKKEGRRHMLSTLSYKMTKSLVYVDCMILAVNEKEK
jgi:ankyrin repeat protein